MTNSIILILLAILFITPSCYGQYCKEYNTSNGLISNNVYHVMSDKQGYLWFCSDKGVVKYNGQAFENFTTSDGLTDNEVYNAYEDLYGRVWFYTSNSRYCYYGKGIIHNSSTDTFIKRIPNYSYINTMFHDPRDSTLYIGPLYGPVIKIKDNSVSTLSCQLKQYSKLRALFPRQNNMGLEAEQSSFIINETCLVKTTGDKVHESFYSKEHLIIADNNELSISKGEKHIWSIEDDDIALSKIYHAYYDDEGYLLCGTKNGLIIFDINKSTKHKFLGNYRISSIAKDIEGNYWLSSLGKGVIKFYNSNIKGLVSLSVPGHADIINKRSGQIFVKNGGMLHSLSSYKNYISQRFLSNNFEKNYEPVYANDSMLFYYHNSNFKNTYAQKISGSNWRTSFPHHFTEIYQTGDSTYILTNKVEIKHVLYSKNRLRFIDSIYIGETIHSVNYIDELKRLYYFCSNILYCYNANTGNIDLVDTLKQIVGNNYVVYDENKILVICGEIINVYHAQNHTLKETSRLHVPIYSIFKLHKNKYVINTNAGYSLVNITSEGKITSPIAINYPIEQNDILALYPLGNFVLCNTVDKLYYFSKNLINQDLGKPKLFFNQIIVDGKKRFGLHNPILTKRNANITIELSPVYYSNNNLNYRYRITDDKTTGAWNKTKSNEISFSFNSPGKYTVEVQAASPDLTKSDIKSIPVTVKPTFFSSVLFYLICIVSVSIIIFMIFRYYARQKRKAFNDELHHMQLEHKAINSLLNPHFIFNAINNIQNLVNHNSKEEANEYLATLSIMIRQNVQNLQFSIIPLRKELGLINNYVALQNLRFDNKIKYNLANNSSDDVHIPPLLIHTFVENAIIHGFNREDALHININIKPSADNYLTITIMDNGIGINNSKTNLNNNTGRKSFGISFSEKRLQRLSSFYSVDYMLKIVDRIEVDKTKGTMVIIKLYAGFYKLMHKANALPLTK